MKIVKTVLSKELARVFHDKKMIFSIFILPIVLIFAMFGLINFLAGLETEETESHVQKVYVSQCPDSFKNFLTQSGRYSDIREINADEVESIKTNIKEGSADLLITFETDFDKDISAQQLPDIGIYYNPSEDTSGMAFDSWSMGLESYRQVLQTQKFGSIDSIMIFTVNDGKTADDFQLYDSAKAAGKMFGNMLPYFITLLLFAGAMSLGIDSIAGEKERGTMASLLVTPVKRTNIVLGKLIFLMIVSVISALIYVLSLGAALPMLGGNGSEGQITEMMSSFVSIFSPLQFIELLIIMIGILFCYVAIIGLVSVYAKDTKEASTYVMPAYFVVIGAGMVTMFGSASKGLIEYAIPFYNCSIALKAIFMGEMSTVQFLVSAGSMFVTGGIITAIIGKMFNSEKVMFNS